MSTAHSFPMEQHPEEIYPFAEWLRSRHPHNALEIGVRRGGTSALWCEICTGVVVGIDWFGKDSLGEEETMTVHRALSRAYPRFQSIIGNSKHKSTIERADIGQSYDLIFIDGDHSYEGVRNDYLNYQHLLSNSGCFAFHDIVESDFMKQVGHGVWKFWKELKEEYPGRCKEFSINGEWGGIGAFLV